MRAWLTAAIVCAAWPHAGAAAQAPIALVCDIEEAYQRDRLPIGWRPRGRETFVVDLRLQRRFGDGSCCTIDAPSYHVTVLPDMFIFHSKRVPRERFSIDRYTGQISGAMGFRGTFVRGACQQGRRQF